MKMRIGFLLLQNELNGLGGWIAGYYFIRNCLHAIGSLQQHEIPDIYLFVPEAFKLEDDIKNCNWLTIIKISEVDLLDVTRQSVVEDIINDQHCDIFFPLLTVPKFVLKGLAIGWIPDFQHKHLPENFSEDELIGRDITNHFMVSYCDKILCTSDTVTSDLKKLYPEFSHKSSTMHFRSMVDNNSINPDAVLDELNLKNKKYIYLPNQFWKHKNHWLVLHTWKILKEMGANYLLICTGSVKDYRFPEHYKELTAFLEKNNLTDNIKILGFIERDIQIQLYRGASAILQPSFFEGWNTSLEEAKAFGKFIFASDIPVHREQCNDDVAFFNPNSPLELAALINNKWHGLSGFDITREQKAKAKYALDVQNFGRQLTSLFKQLMNDTSKKDVSLLKLPVLLQRQLWSRELDCKNRLDLVNRLTAELCELRELYHVTRKYSLRRFLEVLIPSRFKTTLRKTEI